MTDEHELEKEEVECNGDSDERKSNSQECCSSEKEEEGKENEALMKDVTQLSEAVFIYQNRKMSDHGNVFEGEIRSGVYGVRLCAIKFARKSEQNVREAKILTKLGQHTHVISIIQSGIYNDMLQERVYIALDKCHKQNLQQHITHQKESGFEFNLKEALEYSKQIIAGVTYVHENLVIHKDLKPSNILLSHDKSTIKLADFGLSQEIKSTSSKVYSKHQFGTNGFRPIESFGNNWASLKSDIFSIGVVLYFVLSNGRSPFGDDISLWIYNTRNGTVDLSHLLVSNANTFRHLIKLMLSAERCRRPSICQVADHPCWTEKEVECNFGYGFSEEVDDSDVKIPEQQEQVSSDSDSEVESRRQLLRTLHKMGYKVSPNPETFILMFDMHSKCLQRFNPKNKSITRMHEFNEEIKRDAFTSVAIGDYVYVLKRSLYRLKYRDVTATWERMADLVEDHGSRPPAVVVSGAIYVAGGRATNLVSKYEPSLNQWERLNNKHLATNEAAIVACNGHIYCIGGFSGGIDSTNRVERMNVRSQTWEEVSPMTQPRSYASAFECYGYIMVAGGWNGRNRAFNSVERYDPDLDQWIIMNSMRERYVQLRFHLIQGSFYAVGGFDSNLRKVRTIEKYGIERDEWTFFHDLGLEMDIWDSVTVKMEI